MRAEMIFFMCRGGRRAVELPDAALPAIACSVAEILRQLAAPDPLRYTRPGDPRVVDSPAARVSPYQAALTASRAMLAPTLSYSLLSDVV